MYPTKVANEATGPTLIDCVKGLEEATARVYTKIYGTNPLGLEQKTMPGSILLELQDRILECNRKLNQVADHMDIIV